MVKGACYVRVSTDNQLDNYSIEEQTERLEAYCLAKDIHIVKIYTDGGYSGGNTNRPALQQMLTDIDTGIIDTVIVYKLDRLSRSQKDTLNLIEDRFLAKNVNFISINENFDTSTPFGRAMIGILSVFAQLEKDQITERFTMGRIGRAKSGYYHGGPTAPTGYDYVDGKLIDLYQIDGISIETISQKIKDLAREKEALDAAAKKPMPPRRTLDDMIRARDSFLSIVKNVHLEEKRSCLFMLIDKITINDVDIDIRLRKI